MATITGLIFISFIDNNLPVNTAVDKLVVLKSERLLNVYSNGRVVKSYMVALGRNPKGDKLHEGDFKTPEGSYYINDKNPNSMYFKNLGISYPNQQDKEQARKIGKPAGGDIKIHGLKNGFGWIGGLHTYSDWTAGCIAVTNEEMEELYTAVKIGTPIEIKP